MKRSALFSVVLTVSTGVVASMPPCRVTVTREYRLARHAAHRRGHHSAETLARWKAGSAAWSLAHGGKVYRGVPARRVVQTWTPLQFGCADVTTVPAEIGGLLPMDDALPIPESYAVSVPVLTTIPPTVNGAGVAVAGPVDYPPTVGGVPVFGGPVGLPSAPVPAPEPSGWLMMETGIAILVVARWMKR